MSLLRRAMRLGLAALVGLGVSGASCGQRGLAIMPGVINDPANLTLRKAILGFAWSRICPELRARSVPLQLRDTDPAIGRYFATGCAVRELANGNLFVQVLGHGYAWTNITLRIGFEASAAVEYEHDFLLDGSTMYVYLRERSISTNEFKPLVVERQQASGPGAALFGSTVAAASQQIGERVLRSKLAEGFTVVRDPDGTTEFAMGVLEKGRRPEAPFAKGESDWLVLANERTELHHGQRDYAGPFRIEGDDAALYLTVVVEG
ncbi:MAG: hypothetical protein HY744_00215, partial [Deltaproteobacteria bacterium]|nr:hypothetical protein [Deltaproteobacteria bacterium]